MRLAAEKKATDEANAAREADEKHCQTVETEALAALVSEFEKAGRGDEDGRLMANHVILAVMQGLIPHVTLNY